MQKSKVCIIIPVYREISDSKEILSLEQGLKTFSKHPIFFILPASFNQSSLGKYFKEYPNLKSQIFADDYFQSTRSYNRLLLGSEIYKKFEEYQFMLIYQTDAYVFEDQLNYWCEQNLDFIGAPWFKKFDVSGKEKEFIPVAGNGGFSLRNISKINSLMNKKLKFGQMINLRHILAKSRIAPHKNLLFSLKFFANFFYKTNSLAEINECICKNTTPPNEDYFFAYTIPKIFPEFKSANANQAIAFSFEAQPENLYKINGNKLPFGCHAWVKYSPDFWKKFINF